MTLTMGQCVQLYSLSCTSKPKSPDSTPTVLCYGATGVNEAMETACLNAIAATSCDDVTNLTYTYDDTCSQVCTTGSTTGAGGAGGAGGASGNAGATGAGGALLGTAGASGAGGATAGSGGAGTTGAGGSVNTGAAGTFAVPPDAMTFCLTFASVDCDQVFKCIPPSMQDDVFISKWGQTIIECKTTKAAQNCDGFGPLCGSYSPQFAQACLIEYSAESCEALALAQDVPPDCHLICQP
jgi:hypothetical protein